MPHRNLDPNHLCWPTFWTAIEGSGMYLAPDRDMEVGFHGEVFLKLLAFGRQISLIFSGLIVKMPFILAMPSKNPLNHHTKPKLTITAFFGPHGCLPGC